MRGMPDEGNRIYRSPWDGFSDANVRTVIAKLRSKRIRLEKQMPTRKKLKAPEVRDLKASELIRLRAMGESIATKALGSDWKKRHQKRVRSSPSNSKQSPS